MLSRCPGKKDIFMELRVRLEIGCSFFAYNWKLPAYSGAFLLTVGNFSFFTYNCSFFAYIFSFLSYSWGFFAYSGEVRLLGASRDCKQRSLTVSKKAPTASKKASPLENFPKIAISEYHGSGNHYTIKSPTIIVV